MLQQGRERAEGKEDVLHISYRNLDQASKPVAPINPRSLLQMGN